MLLPQEWSCHGAGQEPGGLLAHRGICCSTESSTCGNQSPGSSTLSQPQVLRPMGLGSAGGFPLCTLDSCPDPVPRANHSILSRTIAPAGNSPLGSTLGDPSGKGRAQDGMRLWCPFKGDRSTRASPLPLQAAKPGLRAANTSSTRWVSSALGSWDGFLQEGGKNPTPPGCEGSSSVAMFGSYRKFYKAQPCLVQGEIKIHRAHK